MHLSSFQDDRPVIIFGNQMSASLAWYCLSHDSSLSVAGFAVDAAYITSTHYEGLPLVPFEQLQQYFPPSDYRFLVPMGFSQLNGVRMARYKQAKAWGYIMASYVSSRASVWPDLVVGDNVLIYEHAIVQPFARVGSNCIIRSGAHVSHHCQIADHVFVSAGVTMASACQIGEQAILGVGSVLRDGVQVAPRSFVGAGAVVVSNTEEDCVYVGNPARKLNKSALLASEGK